MVEMRRCLLEELRREGPVGLVRAIVVVAAATLPVTTVTAGPLSAQELAARAYLEPPEVEVGEEFALKIEVMGVSEVEELVLPREFPFARPPSDAPFALMPSDDVLPYTMEITPATAQTAGSVTFSYSLVAREAGSSNSSRSGSPPMAGCW